MAKRVIVIGAGIVGVSCAAYLLRDGNDVCLVDREGPAAGASFGNAGALSPGSCIPLAMPGVLAKTPSWLLDRNGPLVVRPGYALRAAPWLLRFVMSARPSQVARASDALAALHRRVYEDYEPLIAAAGCRDLIRHSGTLTAFSSEAAYRRSESEFAMRRARGATIERIESHEMRQLEPALSDYYGFAAFQPGHGYAVDPALLVTRIFEWFTDNGGAVMRAGAARLVVEGGKTSLALDSGEVLPADAIIIAAGAWSAKLLRSAGVRVPLETQRGYHLTLTNPSMTLSHPISLSEEKVYLTPMRGGLRVAGTVEFAGLDAAPNWDRAYRLIEPVQRALPGLRYDEAKPWMGHRPCLPDSLPMIGPVRSLPGVLAAFGHGHNGMTGGPVTGRIVSDLVAGRAPPIDIAPYRPERFSWVM
ncbi:MAG: NAD(P)/FAD-dependent oxidoreductase [Variibacter sp.]